MLALLHIDGRLLAHQRELHPGVCPDAWQRFWSDRDLALTALAEDGEAVYSIACDRRCDAIPLA